MTFWFCYNQYARRDITERKLETMRDALRPVCPDIYPTEFYYIIPLLGREEEMKVIEIVKTIACKAMV